MGNLFSFTVKMNVSDRRALMFLTLQGRHIPGWIWLKIQATYSGKGWWPPGWSLGGWGPSSFSSALLTMMSKGGLEGLRMSRGGLEGLRHRRNAHIRLIKGKSPRFWREVSRPAILSVCDGCHSLEMKLWIPEVATLLPPERWLLCVAPDIGIMNVSSIPSHPPPDSFGFLRC